MKFLLDTDTCVFWLRGKGSVRDRVKTVGASFLAISAITLVELCYGASCSVQDKANHQAIDDFISGIKVLETDAAVAVVLAILKHSYASREC